jgi:putative nucleotidyltransferase with HDIG domain
MLRTRVRAGAIAGFVMSLVFAILLTLIERADTLIPELALHYGQPAPVTLRVPYAPLIVKSAHTGIAYSHARVVIPRGTILDPTRDSHRVALAFEAVRQPIGNGSATLRLLAVLGIFFTLFFLASTYMRRFGTARTRLLRVQLGIFAAMTGLVFAAKALLLFTPLSEFWIPLATVPLWVVLSFDRRTAFLLNVMLAFMASSLLLFDLPLLIVLITRGLASSLLFTNKKYPRQMVVAGLGGGVVAFTLYAALMIVFEGSYSPFEDVLEISAAPLIAIPGGGLMAGLLALLLRHPAERLLGSVSRDRLIDLTDLEQPLLKKMAAEAPGSWEHSRAMANLAEAAAAAIGADTLLTRVGAYYHDLGKTIQPKYFVENLLGGEPSPHDQLEPDVSADAIMAHVVQGAKILREGGIPEPVVEFAYTHHGTQVIEFFWHKCQERNNPKALGEDFFRYPGMKPQTKETAILMLVDSIEAASRTIQPPERAKFEEMIQRVVFTKLKSGQLDESGLTLEDIRTLTTKMADTLVNMFHGRIKYPWQREGGQREGGVSEKPPGQGEPESKRGESQRKLPRPKPN